MASAPGDVTKNAELKLCDLTIYATGGQALLGLFAVLHFGPDEPLAVTATPSSPDAASDPLRCAEISFSGAGLCAVSLD